MNILGFTITRTQPKAKKPKCLVCANCNSRIRKGERWHSLTAAHDDCSDKHKDALPGHLLEYLDTTSMAEGLSK